MTDAERLAAVSDAIEGGGYYTFKDLRWLVRRVRELERANAMLLAAVPILTRPMIEGLLKDKRRLDWLEAELDAYWTREKIDETMRIADENRHSRE